MRCFARFSPWFSIDRWEIVMNNAHFNTYGANYLADQYIAADRRLLVPSPNSGSAQ